MFRFLTVALVLLQIPVTMAQAEDRSRVCYDRLITNNFIGDGKDHWRTGSVASSRVWGPECAGELQTAIGEILELRLGAEIIAPESLNAFDGGDRSYGTSLVYRSAYSLLCRQDRGFCGLDLVFVGPQTGLSQFQRALPNALGVPDPIIQFLTIKSRIAPIQIGPVI